MGNVASPEPISHQGGMAFSRLPPKPFDQLHFDNLVFRTSKENLELTSCLSPYHDETRYKCLDYKVLQLSEQLEKIKIAKIEVASCYLQKNTLLKHWFLILSGDEKYPEIHMDFFKSSKIYISIDKKPLEWKGVKDNIKLTGKSRKVATNLRYWIRKALTNASNYSLLLNNCEMFSNNIIKPNNKIDKIKKKLIR